MLGMVLRQIEVKNITSTVNYFDANAVELPLYSKEDASEC